MSLIKDMSGFRYVSFASIIALFYTGIVLLVELPEYARKNYTPERCQAAIWSTNIFTSAAKTFFAFTCQVQLLPIYSELINPNERRIKKVVSRSMFIDLLFYLVIASAGYFSTFDQTPAIVLERETLNGERDYAILVSLISIIVVLFVAVPVNYNPFRN
jgi:amino acid permease